MKACITCKQEKELEDFHNRKNTADGKASICKVCKSAYDKKINGNKRTCLDCHRIIKGSRKKCEICAYENKCPFCGDKIARKSKSCFPCFSIHFKGENSYKFKGNPKKSCGGYMRQYSPNHPRTDRFGYVAQHVVIMEDFLKRPLRWDDEIKETVHHKNGLRNDNRIENLELWSSQHPPGQRIKDLIIWAKEILERYGDDENAYDTE